jgi:hypothetical protein
MPEGVKYDAGKPRLSLLPWSSVLTVVEVLEFGARKYAVDNWQRVDNAPARYADAALRHIVARLQGERDDDESGLPHLAHAATCLLFWMWFDAKENGR